MLLLATGIFAGSDAYAAGEHGIELAQTYEEDPRVVPTVPTEDLAGPARVINGDTLEVVGTRIRIHGIDAPETEQLCSTAKDQTACGRQATRQMRDLIAGQPVRCERLYLGRLGRPRGVCFNAEGLDLGREMVRTGWALAYRQDSLDYVADEEAASAARKGLWETTFTPPWEWRKEQDE